jgi:hypothetical protein
MAGGDPQYVYYFPDASGYFRYFDNGTYNSYSDPRPADTGYTLLLSKGDILTNYNSQLKTSVVVDWTNNSTLNATTPNYNAFNALPSTFQWIQGGTESTPVLYDFGDEVPIEVDQYTPLFLYPYLGIPCFKEDTKILTDKGYRQIKELRKGDMVKTLKEGYRPVNAVGYTPFQNNSSHNRIKNQLYIYQKDKFAELTEDLVLTGSHSVLVKELVGDQRKMVNEALGQIFVTEGHYRLPAYLDERAEIYQTKGPFNVYHLCLEGADPKSNHGIYANGLLAETCFIRELKTDRWTLL